MAVNIVGVGRTERKKERWLGGDREDCECKRAAALDTAPGGAPGNGFAG